MNQHHAPGADRPVIGIDLGGTHMQVGLVGPDHTILHRLGGKTNAEHGPDAVLDAMADHARRACAGAGVTLDDCAALGIGSPGAIDFEHGVVIDAPNLYWKDLPLRDELSSRLDGIAVRLENDVNAAVLGECALGAGRGATDAIGAWIGTGVGGGIIINGAPYRGPLGTAGEIGQTILAGLAPGPALADVDHHRMERHASRHFVTQALIDAVNRGASSSLAGPLHDNDGHLSPSDLASAYESGDDLAVSALDNAADFIGITIANTITVLSIPLVILGGGLMETMPRPYIDRIERTIKRAVFPHALGEHITVRTTELKENAGLLGAALTAHA